VGAAFGAAWMGERPIAELQFADFISCAFDPIVTVGAKTHWRSGIKLPVVIRAPFGGGIRGGPFHASCPEGFFVGTAGLKVVCPGSVEDAYGLLRSAIEDDDPVLYFEHKALYRRLRAEAPDASLRTPIGRAQVARTGTDVTLIAYGAMVDLGLRAADVLAGEASVEVLDLRTVWPLDETAILESLARTSRALRAAGGELVARSCGAGALADRARGLRAARRAARARRRAGRAGAVSRPSSRTPTSRPSSASSASCGDSVATDPAAREALPCSDSDEVTREGSARAPPAHPDAPPDRGARRRALPRRARLRLGLHGPRPGGRRRGRRIRDGPRRRLRAAQPGARLPPRARGHGDGGVSATSSARATPPRADATATCTSARGSTASSRSLSMLGDLCPLVVGAALAFKRRREPRVA